VRPVSGLGEALKRGLLAVEEDGEDEREQHPDHAEERQLVIVLREGETEHRAPEQGESHGSPGQQPAMGIAR
jgi:hypothetical protein